MPDAGISSIINAGSSSIKFSLFEIGGSRQLTLASVGEAEGIGTAPHFVARDRAGTVLAEQRWPDPNPPFQSISKQSSPGPKPISAPTPCSPSAIVSCMAAHITNDRNA